MICHSGLGKVLGVGTCHEMNGLLQSEVSISTDFFGSLGTWSFVNCNFIKTTLPFCQSDYPDQQSYVVAKVIHGCM